VCYKFNLYKADKTNTCLPYYFIQEVKAMTVKPFVKWVGGKSQLLNEIRLKYPKDIKKYCEPFVGGGAVLFDVLDKLNPSEVLINDINMDLINAYIQVRDNIEFLIAKLSQMQTGYWNANEVLRIEIYYATRDNYNKKNQNDLERAAQFIFLNKTCINGLYRVNKAGMFNVSIGSYERPLICDTNNLLAVSEVLQNVVIKCGDYSECVSFITDGTFVYIDTP
jgi:DNA adenine methylase